MKQPKGFATEGKEGFVCKLRKAYMVYATLDCHFKDLGFYPSASDPCIYVRGDVFALEFMWMT